MKRKSIGVYAARVGTESKIFKTWADCQKFTHGKRAQFKKFNTDKEATNWLDEFEEKPINEKDLHIYTDGSLIFADGEQRMGIGACYVHEGKTYQLWSPLRSEEIKLLCSTFDINSINLSSSLTELCAIGFALRAQLPTGYEGITIHVDNDCAPGWLNGSFEVNNSSMVPLVQSVKKLMKRSERVNLVHVAGHSSNKMNDLADSLARKGSHDAESTLIEFLQID
jgi:ribonuclease HI